MRSIHDPSFFSRRRARMDALRRTVAGAAAAVLIIITMTAGSASSFAAGFMPRAGILPRTFAAVQTPLGLDLDDVGQSAGVVFADAMKQAAPWSSDRALALDDGGNVTQLAPGQVAQTIIYPFAQYPSGDYTLLYSGRGSIDIDPRSGSIASVATGRAVVHVTARPGFGIRLRLTATNSRDYLRDIRLVLPGLEPSYQNQPFAPAFLARVAPFNVLRFVHWSHADTSATSLTWPMRSTVTQFTQAGPQGVAWEYQIALANAVGADPWFVVPAGATNFSITQLAALVHARLDPRLHPMFEYADATWRPGSPANTYAVSAGRNFRLAADAQTAALAWYALRSTQLYALVAEAFGADANRIVRVLSGAAAAPHTPAESVNRTILTASNAGARADVFAIDASAAGPGAIAATRALLGSTRLSLAASGGALSFTAAQNVAASTQSDLDAWRSAGGGLFVASSLDAYLGAAGALARVSAQTQAQLDALRLTALAAYARLHPTGHVVPRPLVAQSVLAPQTAPNSYFRTAAALPAAAATDVIAIDAGGPALAPWVADIDHGGGGNWAYTTTTAVSTTGVTNPAPAGVYQSQRTGPVVYTMPGLTAGTTYTVRLHFAELYFKAAGQRTFNVTINGATVLSNFDVFAVAGGEFKAVVENVSAVANASGQVTIGFVSVVNNPIVNGIEVQTVGTGPTPTPTPTPTATPTGPATDVIAIDAGGPALAPWVADTDHGGGGNWAYTTTTAVSTTGVTNPAPAGVYQSQRTGPVAYTIPGLKAGTTYPVRLHFAELYFKAAGQRTFDVTINGATVLSSFDVFAVAGGEFKAIVEKVSAVANASGQITIGFVSVVNNPIVNGIEVQTIGSGPPPTPTPTPTATPPGSPADVTTFHNDNLRTGWNPSETILNATNVASAKFGLRQTLGVDGLVLAQPLFVANYPVNGTNRNLLIVATEHDSVYAFDASSGALLWQRSLGTPQSSADVGCTDIEPEYGITSTPVVDHAAGTIYVVYATETSSKVYGSFLGALDLATGNNKLTPVQISASAVQSNGSKISYSASRNMQRASLLLASGSVYLGFGSHCDFGNTSVAGWLMRYSTSNLAQLAAFNTVEDGVTSGQLQLASIWGAGFGPAADRAGDIYAITGNGPFDAGSGGRNFGMSVLRFPADLSGVSDYFAYANEAADSANDEDFGSGGAMLLPTQSGADPNILVAMGKTAEMYLLDQGNLGHFSSTNAGALQVLSPGSSSNNQGVWGGPAYFNGPNGPTIYYQASIAPMRAFALATGGARPRLSLASQAAISAEFGGAIPAVSSNGASAGTGVVWAVRTIRHDPAAASVQLDAYDATNVATHLFGATAGTWSHAYPNGFVAPLVANGRVYTGAYKTVSVFGLTP